MEYITFAASGLLNSTKSANTMTSCQADAAEIEKAKQQSSKQNRSNNLKGSFGRIFSNKK